MQTEPEENMAFNKKKKAGEAPEEKVNAEMAEPETENEEQKENKY